jgi:hypothetical protein
MSLKSFCRKDLIQKFPNTFTFSGLVHHFTNEYKHIVGVFPSKKLIKYLAAMIQKIGIQ